MNVINGRLSVEDDPDVFGDSAIYVDVPFTHRPGQEYEVFVTRLEAMKMIRALMKAQNISTFEIENCDF